MIFNLVIFSIGLLFLLKGYYKGLLIVLIISITNDLFAIPLGFSLSIHHALALIYAPVVFRYFIKNAGYAKTTISPLLFEIGYLFLLALLFGFLYPWRSDYDYLRSWNQQAEGRAVIQVIRLFADLSVVLLLYFLLETKRISFEFLLKVFAVITTLNVLLVLLNYLLDNRIKLLLFPEVARDIINRFTGLNNEPRSLGRMCSISALFLMAFLKRAGNKIIIIGIISSFIGLLLSFSASAFIMTAAWLMVIIFLTKRIKALLIPLLVVIATTFFVTKNEVFQNQTKRKIEQVFVPDKLNASGSPDKIDNIEPKLFTRFEVFDRAALNFLYRNPIFGIIGTGPNLISIPASPYLSKSAKAIYGKRIDSVPHSLFVNILSRSGLLGLLLWSLFFRRMSSLLLSEEKLFFWGLVTASMIVNNSLIYFFIGILLFFSETDAEQTSA